MSLERTDKQGIVPNFDKLSSQEVGLSMNEEITIYMVVERRLPLENEPQSLECEDLYLRKPNNFKHLNTEITESRNIACKLYCTFLPLEGDYLKRGRRVENKNYEENIDYDFGILSF